MPVVNELLRADGNGTLSFGNYELDAKKKLEDYEFEGNLYKVKTYHELTKLERDGMFVYESEPGTAVHGFAQRENGVEFLVSAKDDVQITIGLKEDTEYDVIVADKSIGKMKTNLSGKLSFSVELTDGEEVKVKIVE